jgi:hypothetical protein
MNRENPGVSCDCVLLRKEKNQQRISHERGILFIVLPEIAQGAISERCMGIQNMKVKGGQGGARTQNLC